MNSVSDICTMEYVPFISMWVMTVSVVTFIKMRIELDVTIPVTEYTTNLVECFSSVRVNGDPFDPIILTLKELSGEW